jgi:8-oxo-dGTP pyrophosphatase MutT (NUDIX family)
MNTESWMRQKWYDLTFEELVLRLNEEYWKHIGVEDDRLWQRYFWEALYAFPSHGHRLSDPGETMAQANRTLRLAPMCGVVCYNRERTQVMAVRESHSRLWSIPKGKRFPSETLVEGCLREWTEETHLPSPWTTTVPDLVELPFLHFGRKVTVAICQSDFSSEDIARCFSATDEIDCVAWVPLKDLLSRSISMNSITGRVVGFLSSLKKWTPSGPPGWIKKRPGVGGGSTRSRPAPRRSPTRTPSSFMVAALA